MIMHYIVIVQLTLAENANHVNSEQSVHLFEYRDFQVHMHLRCFVRANSKR